MKFPISMLREFVATPLSAEEVGDLLTMAGFELEGIEEVEGEEVLDIKVVSNRGDGLSVFGLAREILAKDAEAKPTDLYLRAVARFPANDGASSEALGSIETTDCLRFGCRAHEGVSVGPSPEWLQKRIRQAGWRPLNFIVDVTNYVMLELGQPLHAYDRAKLSGGRLTARLAREGERLKTLNGEEHELQPYHMVIADEAGPVGVAGVMGGLDSEVTDDTKTILLEAANFLNTSVRKTRRELGFNTEASYRFERSVDPELVVGAINRCFELWGFPLEGGVSDVYPARPKSDPLQVRESRWNRLLGMTVTVEEATRYLEGLGFTVSRAQDGLMVERPTWRPDIVREDDLVEEIGRVHGFDRIPERLPLAHTVRGGLPHFTRKVDQTRVTLTRLGFNQAISHSLRAAHALDSDRERIGPRQPGSPDYALLRNSILPSLADAARRNGGRDLQLFETGKVFWREGERVVERDFLGVLCQGHLFPPNRANEIPPSADFYAMKGVMEALGAKAFEAPKRPDPRLHPTRQAAIEGAGVFGQIHPDLAEVCGLPADTFLAEIDLAAWFSTYTDEFVYKSISRNPSVRRDLAFIAPKSLPYSQIENALELACGSLLERQWLFDVYEGTGIPEGKHSLAIALTLRKQGENFTDEEANQVRERAVSALQALGATMRG